MCCAFANPQSSFFFFENIWLLHLPTKILKRLLFSLSFFRCSWYATAAAAILCRNPSTLRSFSFVFYIEKKKSYSFLEKYRGELRWQRRQLNAFLLFCSLYWKEWNLICFSLYYFFFSLQVDHYLETYIDGEPCNGTFYPSSYSQSDSVFGSMCTDSTFYSF